MKKEFAELTKKLENRIVIPKNVALICNICDVIFEGPEKCPLCGDDKRAAGVFLEMEADAMEVYSKEIDIIERGGGSSGSPSRIQ